MSSFTPSLAPANETYFAQLVEVLLDVSTAGVLLLRPVYDAAGAAIADFAFEHLNPAAQQMLRLPERPAGSFLTLFPATRQTEVFAFYCAAFASGQTERHQNIYQHDGLDGYYHLVARRSGEHLVVSFTDTNDQSRTAVEEALRQSQQREQAARAQAEADREALRRVLEQAPLALAILDGPERVVTLATAEMGRIWGQPLEAVVGRPQFEAVPELRSQGFEQLLARITATSEAHYQREAPIWLDRAGSGQPALGYFNVSYQPLRDGQGATTGIVAAAVEVTEQVLARQQVQGLNEELAASNEELRATNEEYLLANTALADTQQQLRQLNQELEARVHERAQKLAEQQRLLAQILGQVPAAVATLSGPTHRFTYVNKPYQAIVEGRAEVGRPLAEVLPEALEQGFVALLDAVYATGQPYYATDVAAVFHDPGAAQPRPCFLDLVYQPLRDEAGQTQGILAFVTDVTERVRRGQQLQEARADTERQRQRLEQLVLRAPLSICVFDGPAWVYELVNPRYQAMFPGRNLLGKPLVEALPEVAGQPLMDILHHVYNTGQPFESREVLVPLARTETSPVEDIYFDLTYQARFDEHGQIDGFVTYALDVTEQVLARQEREALQAEVLAAAQRQVQARENLYQVFEQTPAIVALLRGPAHRIEYANPACQQLFPGLFLPGHLVTEGLPEAQAQEYLALLDQVYQTGETFLGRELPFVVVGEDGQPARTTYLNFTYQAYRAQEQIVGISTFAYDVTQQVLARQEREAQQQLIESVFAQAPVAIFVAQGPEYVFELVNPPMEQLLGHGAAQLRGVPYFEALPELRSQGVPELLARAWQGEAVYVAEQPFRLAYQAEGELSYFSSVFQPLRDAQGQVDRIACVGIDVTAQVQARQQVQMLNHELRDSNERLTRANADLDTFVYTASHDLKSPITNIAGLLGALREQLPVAALQAELVATLLELLDGSVQRFQQTLDQLTDVTRLQRIMQDQPAEAVDLPALAEGVRLDLLPELTAAQATLTVELAACPTVHFPAKILRSVLYNLLSNAVKYRAPDRLPQVQLRGQRLPSGQLVLSVQDNGLGLSEEQQRNLFQLFRRLHTHVPGSGVGLYTIKRLVDNAGGTLTVQSRPGVGSTFAVTLPAPKGA